MRKHADGVIMLAGMVFLTLVFLPLASLKFLPLEKDFSTGFLPGLIYFGRQIREGQWPLWTPYQWGGFPLFAEGELGALSPLSIIFVFFPDWRGGNFLILAHLMLLFCFMFAYLRCLNLSQMPCFISALAVTLSPYVLSNVFSLNVLRVVAWQPAVFLFAHLAFTHQKVTFGVAAAASLAAQYFGGYPQTALAGFLGFFAYAFFFLFSTKPRRKTLSMACGIILGSMLICAVQALPFLEFFQHAARGIKPAFSFAAKHSFPPALLVQMLFQLPLKPSFQLELFPFPNVSSQALLLLALIGGMGGRKKNWVPFYLMLAALALLLSFGQYGFLYPLIAQWTPLAYFRSPSRTFGFLATFSLGVLMAFGLQSLARPGERKVTMRRLGAFLTAALMAYLYVQMFRSNRVFHWPTSLAFPAALLFWLWLARKKVSFSAKMLLLAIFLVPYALLALQLQERKALPTTKELVSRIISGAKTGEAYFVLPKAFVQLEPCVQEIKKRKSLFRVYDFDHRFLPPDLGHIYNLQQADGYYAVPRKMNDLYEVIGIQTAEPTSFLPLRNLLALFNVRYLLAAKEIKGSHLTRLSSGSCWLYENHFVLPRSYLVGNFKVIKNKREALLALTSRDFPLRKVVLLDEPPRHAFQTEDPGQAKILAYAPQKVTVEVKAKERSFLVLLDAAYPGWKAYLDGRPVKIYTANYFFRGVLVPEGRHQITFKFQPLSFWIGLMFSFGFLLFSFWTMLGRSLRTLFVRVPCKKRKPE